MSIRIHVFLQSLLLVTTGALCALSVRMPLSRVLFGHLPVLEVFKLQVVSPPLYLYIHKW